MSLMYYYSLLSGTGTAYVPFNINLSDLATQHANDFSDVARNLKAGWRAKSTGELEWYELGSTPNKGRHYQSWAGGDMTDFDPFEWEIYATWTATVGGAVLSADSSPINTWLSLSQTQAWYLEHISGGGAFSRAGTLGLTVRDAATQTTADGPQDFVIEIEIVI